MTKVYCPHRWLLTWNRCEGSCWISCTGNSKCPHSQSSSMGSLRAWGGGPRPHGSRTSVHHTAGMHVLHSAAQLHKVLPHSPLRNEPLLLLKVLWGDRQTSLGEHASGRGGTVIASSRAEQTRKGQVGISCQYLFSPAELWEVVGRVADELCTMRS